MPATKNTHSDTEPIVSSLEIIRDYQDIVPLGTMSIESISEWIDCNPIDRMELVYSKELNDAFPYNSRRVRNRQPEAGAIEQHPFESKFLIRMLPGNAEVEPAALRRERGGHEGKDEKNKALVHGVPLVFDSKMH